MIVFPDCLLQNILLHKTINSKKDTEMIRNPYIYNRGYVCRRAMCYYQVECVSSVVCGLCNMLYKIHTVY